MKKKQKKTAKEINASNGKAAFNLVGQMILAHKEYKSVQEQEKTKRMAIKADLEKYKATIQAQREVLELYLKNEYRQRDEMTKEFLKRLDRALDEGKDSVAIQALDSLEKLVTSSPLSGLAQIKHTFENKNAVLEI